MLSDGGTIFKSVGFMGRFVALSKIVSRILALPKECKKFLVTSKNFYSII